jgi:hypothetical protein
MAKSMGKKGTICGPNSDGEACDYLIRIITKASCFNDRHEKEI